MKTITKNRAIISSVATALIATSTLTFADPPSHAPAWGHRAKEQQRYDERHDYKHHERERYESRRDDTRYNQVRRYKRGERIERVYLNDRYYVSDWRARRLEAPPSGYQWVNRDGQYLLVALATGIIAHVILNR